MRSLVTGACGFVGRHLVDALVARGDVVTAVDLEGEPPRGDVHYESADIRDFDRLAALCEGQDVVFHNASVVHTRTTHRETVWSVNHGGTRTVIAACRAKRVPRLVYVSSASVVYEGRDIEGGDEQLPYAAVPQATYAASKIEAEKAVLAADRQGALRSCAVRPHVVFGPGDRRFLPAILAAAERGRLRVGIGRERKLSDFTYVGNLIDALLLADARLAADSRRVGGRSYFVTNGEPLPFFEFVGRMLAGLGLPPVRAYLPYRLAYGLGAVVEAIEALRGGELGAEHGFSRFAVRYMCTHHYFSIERARHELSYRPRVSLDEGIALTCEALRSGRPVEPRP